VSLTSADVAEIMKLVEQSSFDELTLEMEGIKLTLRRGVGVVANGAAGAPHAVDSVSSAPALAAGGAQSGAAHAASAVGGAGASAGPAAGAAPPSSLAPPSDPNVVDVTAPLLGTFYRRPKPGAPPFVDVGSVVEEDTVVAIIEVMKLMNTVRAGVRGTVTEILARDATLVEYGETLLRVRKAG
jgi:acetyl-CoA carboxylase biotin carboxyl carrier protein